MTFEEEFPSLTECRIREENHLDAKHDYINKWRLERDIQAHCLDKARVKEAIEHWSKTADGSIKNIKGFIEELGLK